MLFSTHASENRAGMIRSQLCQDSKCFQMLLLTQSRTYTFLKHNLWAVIKHVDKGFSKQIFFVFKSYCVQMSLKHMLHVLIIFYYEDILF